MSCFSNKLRSNLLIILTTTMIMVVIKTSFGEVPNHDQYLPSIKLVESIDEYNIKKNALMLKDKSSLLTPEEAFNSSDFKPFNLKSIDKKHQTYWLKFRLYNNSNHETQLYVSTFFIDYVEVFRYDHKSDSLIAQPGLNGYLIPPTDRAVQYEQTAIAPIYIPANSRDTYLLKIHLPTKAGQQIAISSIRMGIIGYTEVGYRFWYHKISQFNAFMIGLLFLVICYNIGIWTRCKENVFGYLIFYNTGAFLWHFIFGGFLLWFGLVGDMEIERMIRQAVPFHAVVISFTFFAIAFLETKKHLPIIHKILVTTGIIYIALIGAHSLDWHATAYLIQILCSTTIFITSFIASLIRYMRKHEHMIYFVITSLMMNIIHVIFLYHYINPDANYLIGHYWTQVGLFFEVIIFSIMTSHKFGNFKSDLEHSVTENIALKKQNEKMETELHQKNVHLTSYTMLRIKRNEELKDILDKLSNADSLQNGELIRLKKDIEQLESFDQDWETFNLHFEQVYPGFFLRLKKEHPQLTQNDLRICAFVKMGLPNKEMASISNVSTRAIEKSKERLRKKLGLSQGIKLSGFIEEIG